MLRIILAITLFCAGCVCLQRASADGLSAPIAIAPIGRSGAAIKFPPVSSGGGYTGPGDITTFAFWGGFRSYSAAYAAPGNNPAIDVCDSSTGLTCSTINILSSGALDSATLSSAPACAVACMVKTLYDQSGNGNNLTWSGTAAGPAVTANAIGSSYCMTTSANLAGSHTYTQAQPYSLVGIYKYVSITAGQEFFNIMDNSYVGVVAEIKSAGTNLTLYGGASINTTVSATIFHAFQAVFNNTSSITNIDGTDTTGLTGGTNSITAQPIKTTGPDGPATAIVCELGFVAGTITSGNRSSLNSNMHAAYGGF